METSSSVSVSDLIHLMMKRSRSERRRDRVNLRPPRADLGLLDARFPLELLEFILLQMDIRTLTAFTCVNRRARQLVRSLPIYQCVLEHAKDAWREILRIRSGLSVTLANLYDALCTAECAGCGHFGTHIYLLTGTRVCYTCLTEKDAYRPVPYGLACRVYGLDGRPDLMRALPRMRYYYPTAHLPATVVEAPDQLLHNLADLPGQQHILVDSQAALRAGRAVHGSDEARDRYVAQRRKRECLVDPGNRLVAPLSYFSTSEPRPWTVGLVAEHEAKRHNPFRWAAVIRAPYLNRARNEEEMGFWCRACPPGPDKPPWVGRLYNLAMFEQHLAEFGPIVDGQHQPEG